MSVSNEVDAPISHYTFYIHVNNVKYLLLVKTTLSMNQFQFEVIKSHSKLYPSENKLNVNYNYFIYFLKNLIFILNILIIS